MSCERDCHVLAGNLRRTINSTVTTMRSVFFFIAAPTCNALNTFLSRLRRDRRKGAVGCYASYLRSRGERLPSMIRFDTSVCYQKLAVSVGGSSVCG